VLVNEKGKHAKTSKNISWLGTKTAPLRGGDNV